MGDPNSRELMNSVFQKLRESVERTTKEIQDLQSFSKKHEQDCPLLSHMIDEQVDLLNRRVALAKASLEVMRKVKTYEMPDMAGSVMVGVFSRQMYEISQTIASNDRLMQAVLLGLPQRVEA